MKQNRTTEALSKHVRDEIESVPVLHVDDEPRFGDLVGTYLSRIDDRLRVVSETDPEEGLARLEAEPIDCIISDYQMPGMDGLEFLRAVRDEYPNLPFILFTGKGSEEVASEAINAGVTTYLQKSGPETYELLANEVQNGVRRHRSERQARVARDQLLNLYEQTDGFYILDADWTIVYWNRQIADRMDLPPEEATGRRFWDVFPEATEIDTYEQFHEAMETREPTKFEVRYEPRGYWAEVRAYPVDEGLFVHSRDISDEKGRERELERRNHVLESFANTVSHDLRNPLNVAEGRLRLAQETGDFDHLDEVAEAHNRMRNLIDELLRIARGDDLTVSEVSLRERAEEAWATVTSEGMELVVGGDPQFEAHPTQLRRLFENLFWNALNHGNAETVRVGTFEDGIYVEDDGGGIPVEDRKRVFESGYSTTDEGPGYGLHIVTEIVDMHDWEISVTEGTDGGARFEIRGVRFVGDS